MYILGRFWFFKLVVLSVIFGGEEGKGQGSESFRKYTANLTSIFIYLLSGIGLCLLSSSRILNFSSYAQSNY